MYFFQRFKSTTKLTFSYLALSGWHSSTIAHQSLPQHGPVRAGGLIAAHQPVSGKRILNGGHGRVTFTAATLPSLDCKSNSCYFSPKISQIVEKDGTVYSVCPFTYTVAREAERGWLLKSRWRPTILHLQLAAIVQSHYSWVSFPIHSKLSLSYRFHFCAALGSYRRISQHALQSSGCLTWLKVIEVLYPCESAASSKQFESEALHLFFQPSTLAVLKEALFLWYSDCGSYKEWTIQGERIERTAKHPIH